MEPRIGAGLGKIRHIDVAQLWLQDLVQKGEIKLGMILGKKNPAHMLTKYFAGSKFLGISRSNIVEAFCISCNGFRHATVSSFDGSPCT